MWPMLIFSAAQYAIQSYSQWKAGKAEAEAGEAQRRAATKASYLSDYNAAVANLMAKDAEQRGKVESDKFRSRIRVLVGEQRAGFAAGNVDVGYGSPVDVQADTAFQGELDALTIRSNAAREAWGYRVEAIDLRERAKIQREEGVMMEQAGYQRRSAMRWQAAGTALGGAASIYESAYGFRRMQQQERA